MTVQKRIRSRQPAVRMMLQPITTSNFHDLDHVILAKLQSFASQTHTIGSIRGQALVGKTMVRRNQLRIANISLLGF